MEAVRARADAEKLGDDDLAKLLAGYIESELPKPGRVSVELHGRSAFGGTRENWFFIARWTEGDEQVERRLVLRRDPPVAPFDTDRETEFSVLRAVAAHAPFPTPKPYWVEPTGTWLGRPFIVTEWCPGHYDRAVLRDESLGLEARVALARQYAVILGQLHGMDWNAAGLAGVDPPPDAATAAEREVARWAEQVSEGAPSPMVAEALAWLRENARDSGRLSLVHGDYRPGNSLTQGGHVTAVLDWELAHISDPAEDLGWYTLPTNYEREHFIAESYEREDFYAEYTAAGGGPVDEDVVHYWRVIAALRMYAMSLRFYSSAGRPAGATEDFGRVPRWSRLVWAEAVIAEVLGI